MITSIITALFLKFYACPESPGVLSQVRSEEQVQVKGVTTVTTCDADANCRKVLCNLCKVPSNPCACSVLPQEYSPIHVGGKIEDRVQANVIADCHLRRDAALERVELQVEQCKRTLDWSSFFFFNRVTV